MEDDRLHTDTSSKFKEMDHLNWQRQERERETEAETDTQSSLISMSHQLHGKRDGQTKRQADGQADREVSQLCF